MSIKKRVLTLVERDGAHGITAYVSDHPDGLPPRLDEPDMSEVKWTALDAPCKPDGPDGGGT